MNVPLYAAATCVVFARFHAAAVAEAVSRYSVTRLFGVPTYRWLAARSRVEVEYWAIARSADSIPESLEWPV